MRSASIALVLPLVASCATAPPQAGSAGERRVQYECTGGEKIEMRFFPAQGIGVLVRNGMPIELQQQPAASGFLYSNGPNTVRGKGSEMTVEIGRMVPFTCKAT
ncbi:MAG: MliC family protein [Pseudomonadota bacterium]